MKNILKTTFVLLLVAVISTGCENFLTPSVDQAKPIDQAISSVDDLRAFVYGMHGELNNSGLFGRDATVSPDVMSDNAFSNGNSGRFITQSQFNFTTTNGYANGVWTNMYQIISNANIVINQPEIEGTAEEDYVKGQAYALRAFAHFNLLLNFGQQWVTGSDAGVPIITTYNEGNLIPARDSAADVWAAIVSDFSTAASMMDPSLDEGTTVINYYGVKALQSRVLLYTGDFAGAIAAADEVINNAGFTLVGAADLATTWASGSGPNGIWELDFAIDDRTGGDSIARIYLDTNYGDVEATQDLYDAYDAADARLGLFTFDGTDSYRMTGKFVDELGEDNVRIIRFAEVLLNKAEALARRNSGTDQAEAMAIINNLSATRGSATVYASGSVANVLAERRLELAMEGHRFFDLARHGMDITNTSDPVRANEFNDGNDLPFGDYRYALPIPQNEIDANSSMTQNEGYE